MGILTLPVTNLEQITQSLADFLPYLLSESNIVSTS